MLVLCVALSPVPQPHSIPEQQVAMAAGRHGRGLEFPAHEGPVVTK